MRGCSGETERESQIMGSVVSFSPRSAAVTRNPLPADATGSVVIFPGIRYERAGSISPAEVESQDDGANTRRDNPAPHH